MAKDSNNLNSNRLYVECSDSDESDSDSDTVAVDNIDTTVPPSYFGNIDVKNSSNIIFGNTVSYNGPVTVQQFVNSGENAVDNNINSVDLLANTNGVKPITAVAEKSLPVSFNHKPQHPSHLSQQFSIVLAKDESEESSSKWKPRRWFIVAVGSCILVVVTLIVVLAIVLSGPANPTSKKDDTDWENYYNKSQTLLNGTEGIAPFYSRADWLAQPVGPGDKLKTQPAPLVIISHSATAPCFNNSQCIFQVRKIQTFHMESQGWRDIGYNFLAGGDGGVYEGRGWDLIGAHAYGYNNVSIGICTLGTFTKEAPPQKQIRAVKLLIEEGVRQGKISPRYKLLAHSQVSATESPGAAYYKVIQTWPHWVPRPNATLPEPDEKLKT